MDELGFRIWLADKGLSKKVQSDCISRLKRIERELDHCDLDKHYHDDKCGFILSIFSKKGKDQLLDNFPEVCFPIGKYSMNTYKYSIKKYVEFSDYITSVKQK